MSDDSRRKFTERQGQYLAFIHAYTLVIGRPPAEADMQRFFRVSGPAVHQMVVGLEKAGMISRQPWVARSVRLLVERTLTGPPVGSRAIGQNLRAEPPGAGNQATEARGATRPTVMVERRTCFVANP